MNVFCERGYLSPSLLSFSPSFSLSLLSYPSFLSFILPFLPSPPLLPLFLACFLPCFPFLLRLLLIGFQDARRSLISTIPSLSSKIVCSLQAEIPRPYAFCRHSPGCAPRDENIHWAPGDTVGHFTARHFETRGLAKEGTLSSFSCRLCELPVYLPLTVSAFPAPHTILEGP